MDKRSTDTMAGEWRKQGFFEHTSCRTPVDAASSASLAEKLSTVARRAATLPGKFLMGCALSLCLAAQVAQATQAINSRPRVGLVLGGGGARGAAHIGVLEVLEELRVPIDCVAGTSMGALVAGAYAAGLSPAAMREELGKADWNDLFQDNPDYSELNYRNKELSRRFLPGSEIGVSRNGAQYQGGMVAGQKIQLFFNRLVRADQGAREIETLAIPLSIVATDIGNGERVVLREGSLTKAMRASMSVPGLMAPVVHQGRKLVDGGLVDNLPIREVRDRCQADVVIAVNVGSPLLKPEEVGSLITVSAQMINILTEQNVSRSLAELKATDISLKPDLDGIGAGDFQRNGEAAARGRNVTQAASEKLRHLSVSPDAYASWKARVVIAERTVRRIDEVQIAGLKWVNPAAVERHLRLDEDGTLNVADLEKGLLRAYGDGYYENVDYALLSARDRNILRITPVEKSWGQDYLRFGGGLESNFNKDSTYSLRAAYHKSWLNSLGGQLVAVGEIGKRSSIGMELYQPVDERQRFFGETSVTTSNEAKGIYQNDLRLADFRESRTVASLSGGMNVGLLGQIRAGWRATRTQLELETGLPLFPITGSQHDGGWFAGLDFDQRDRLHLATGGWASRINYFSSSSKNYSKLNVDLRGVKAVDSLVLSTRLSWQTSPKGRLPLTEAATLGGFLNLSGFSPGQLLGDDIRYAQIRAERILGRFPLGLRGDMRVGLALEAGKVGLPYAETQRTGWLNSATLYLGGDTPFGPIYLGYGRSSSSSTNIYLFIGSP